MTRGGADSGESRPVWRRALRAALIGAGVIAGLVAGLVVALQFDAFGTWVARKVARMVVPTESLEVSIDRVSGSWVRSIRVAGLRLTLPEGDTVISVDTLHARYALLPLLRRRLSVDELRVAAPVTRLARRQDGTIGIRGWPSPPDTAPPAPGDGAWTFVIDAAEITRAAGRLTTPLDTVDRAAADNGEEPAREVAFEWDNVHVSLRDLSAAGGLSLVLDSASGRIDVPTLPRDAGVGPLEFRTAAEVADGRIRVDTIGVSGPRTFITGGGILAMPDSAGAPVAVDFELDVDSLPLAVVHAALGNSPDERARLSATLDVGGTTDFLTVDIEAGTSDGGAIAGTAAFGPGNGGPVRYRADLTIASLDPATLTGDSALAGAVDGRLDVDLHGPAASRLAGHADASFDRFTFGPAALRGVRLESTWEAGQATFDLGIEGDDFSTDLAGTIRPLDAVPAYDFDGSFRLRIRGDTSDRAVLAGRIDVEGEGFSPDSLNANVGADLTTIEIMEARLNAGRLVAALDDGHVAWRLAIRDQAAGDIDANGMVTLGETIDFRIDAASIRDFDFAALMGDTVPSRLDASLSGSGEIGAPERTQADFRFTIHDGRYGQLMIDTTAVDATLANGTLDATGRALANAGRLEFEVTAQPFAEVPAYELTRLRFTDVNLHALTADTARSTSLAGTITGSGRGTTVERLALDLTVELDSSRIDSQSISDGHASVVVRDSRIDVGADIAFADSGGIRLAMTGRPFADRPTFDVTTLEFRALNPFAIAAPGAADASLTGSATATIEGLDPQTMAGSGTLRLGESRFNSEPITDGLVEWRVNDSVLVAEAALDFAAGGLTVNADITFAEPHMTYRIDGELHSDRPGRLTGADSLSGSVDAVFSVDGSGTSLAGMSTRIRASADSAVLGDVRVDTLRLAMHIEQGVVTLDTLTLRSNLADVSGGGSVPVSDSAAAVNADFALLATIRSLEPIERWVPIEPLALGTGEIRVAVTGPTGSLSLEADASASAIQLGGTQLVGLTSSVQGRLDPGLTLESASGHLELSRLTVAGTAIRLSRVDGEWNGDELAITGDATVDDRRDVAFGIRVDPRPAAASAVFERFDVRVDQDQWQLADSAAVTWADGIRVDSLTLRAGDQVIAVDGVLDPAGRSDLSARIQRLRIGGIADLIGYERLDGILTASLGVQGPAAEPRITAGIDARLEWQGTRESSFVASIAYDTLSLRLDASVLTDGGGQIAVNGAVPIDLALTRSAEGDTTRLFAAAPGTVDLAIRADSFDIEWIEPFLGPEIARDLAGRLQVDARVAGSQAEPTLSGSMRLADGALTVTGLGVRYQDAGMRITLDGNVARIDSARVNAGGGRMVLDGSVSLPELSLGEFDISATLDRFRLIHTEAYRVSASGTAGISGTTREPRLTGDLHLVESDIYLDSRATGASVRPVELTDEQIRQLEEYFGKSLRPDEQDPSALFDALTIDLDISMSRDTWVRQESNPQLELQLTGNLEVTKQPADSLMLNGRIEAVAQRSHVEQFGKRFTIRQGIVEFRGLPSEALIDIVAVYRVPSTRDPGADEVAITLGIDGTLIDLSLTLGSEPDMENADIVSYLATGRPAERSLDFTGGGNGGLGALGSDFALGQVTGLVEGLAAEEIGLDVIEIQADGLRGATLIAGRYVSPSVYVGFRQPIGREEETPDATSSRESTQVEIEYQLLRWLLLNMEASSSAVSFLLRYRHAY